MGIPPTEPDRRRADERRPAGDYTAPAIQSLGTLQGVTGSAISGELGPNITPDFQKQ
jgi:hypothetical protein